MKIARFMVVVATLAACAAPPERVSDPFSELEVGKKLGPAVYPGLTLAVVLSPNAKNAVQYSDDSKKVLNESMLDLKKPLNGLVTQLRANFKSVTKVSSVEDAKALGTDLVGIVDLYESFSKMGTVFQLDEAVAFVDASGETVDKVSASAKKGVWQTQGGGFSTTGQPQAVAGAQDDAQGRFQSALAASQSLQAFAKRHGASAAVAAGAKTGRSEVDEPSYKLREDPTKYAVVVGVENYESLPSADYAERDAKAIRRHLLALGYPERNLIYLTGEKAGKSGIEKYVESWLPRNVDENSSVFFYFSGHGAPDAATGQAFLMPWDGDAKFLDSTGYPVKKLYAHLAALKAKRIVVALDSCFSGAGGRSVIAKGARPLMTRVDAALPASDKLTVLAAASGEEITGSAEAEGHGLFTYYLLKGLNDRDGSATVKSLYDYLRPQVQDAARRDNRDQTPQLLAPPETSSAKL
jgi:uncharacterized caspase-like protein